MAINENKKTNNRPNLTNDKNRQKVLLPTLKEQQRYVVYHMIAPIDAKILNFRIVHEQIIEKSKGLLGLFDGAKAGLLSAKHNDKTFKGIIRVNNKYVDKLKVCLGLIKSIELEKSEKIPAGKNIFNDVIIDVEYVTGLLNKAEDRMNKA